MFFEELVQFRLLSERRKVVKQYVKKNKGVFDNESHFYRCAVETFIRECEKRNLSKSRKKKQGGKYQ
jgi:hypothetical protein